MRKYTQTWQINTVHVINRDAKGWKKISTDTREWEFSFEVCSCNRGKKSLLLCNTFLLKKLTLPSFWIMMCRWYQLIQTGSLVASWQVTKTITHTSFSFYNVLIKELDIQEIVSASEKQIIISTEWPYSRIRINGISSRNHYFVLVVSALQCLEIYLK